MAYEKNRLGYYIEEYDVLNSNLEFNSLEHLQGINSEKYFQECKSNKNDIELKKYRICRQGMFAYNKATSRNGERISIAYREGTDCLISSSYYCFKIKNEKELIHEYLMLWFSRAEFDRYARFHSWGSATEFFTFESMCETEIEVPPIEEQKRIVQKIKVLENRITCLNSENELLEKTAECIYKKMLSEKKAEITPLVNLVKISAGGDNPLNSTKTKTASNVIPIYSNGATDDGLFGYTDRAKITKPSITISARGYLGYTVLRYEPYTPIVRLISLTPNDSNYLEFLYFRFKNERYNDNGSAQQQVTIPYFETINVEIPIFDDIISFHKKVCPIMRLIMNNKKMITTLTALKAVLLTEYIS